MLKQFSKQCNCANEDKIDLFFFMAFLSDPAQYSSRTPAVKTNLNKDEKNKRKYNLQWKISEESKTNLFAESSPKTSFVGLLLLHNWISPGVFFFRSTSSVLFIFF